MMELLMLHMGKVQEQDVVYGMIVSGGLMLIFMVYVGGAFKCFVVSVVVMCVGTPTLLFRGYGILRTLRPNISLGAAIVTGLAEILLGSCLQYLLSLLIYRQPVSKAAQMRQLQKYM